MNHIKYTGMIGFLCSLLLVSCDGFLDERPSKDIVVPNTAEDLHAILNVVDQMNAGDGFGLIFSDDLHISDASWVGMGELERKGYQWNMALSNAQGNLDSWSSPYSRIFRINLVLEESLSIISGSAEEEKQLEEIRARAKFLRAYHYFDLLEMFSHPILNEDDLDRHAIPLKLTPSIDEIKGLATSREVFMQIITDLIEAAEVLPESNLDLLRPSKAACYGLLARIYLQLKEYEKVLENVEKSLEIRSDLLDFNTVPELLNIPLPRNTYPIPRFNTEVFMHLQSISYSFQNSAQTFVSPEIYGTYDEDDIRKYLYFSVPNSDGNVNFIGNFSGSFQLFTGITIGELYLMKAEALVRLGNSQEALETLNEFLPSRYLTGTFEPFSINDAGEVLDLVLLERRKELINRGLNRWRDLRRFLGDSGWQGPVGRTIQGELYELGTKPENYRLEIPPNEQSLNNKL
ncbi:RagB/SusD family nutrient uptake outer membrane protein [Algoriphagus sp. NG3]|uniref:RagB/SusD family nutrient uptake outer membrane protein n=1 Tax=Algoriphagus sp. NG3 TaxID=3097546 RepID=UPI002A814283|nr:RagB/SusD family nutrient uptake outer membrane protein [Algoriphagus sp. NG3]WPR77500.1 RagB/SusD family nutrient uptake outer membrane protein [Algoriphagus sp. NG3]